MNTIFTHTCRIQTNTDAKIQEKAKSKSFSYQIIITTRVLRERNIWQGRQFLPKLGRAHPFPSPSFLSYFLRFPLTSLIFPSLISQFPPSLSLPSPNSARSLGSTVSPSARSGAEPWPPTHFNQSINLLY